MTHHESPLCQALSDLRFFAGLPDEAIRSLAAISQVKSFPAGATLFAEGSKADELFVVQDGRVELSMTVPARGRMPILTLEAGDLIGWSGVAGNTAMTASATASSATSTIAIAASQLLELCERDHEFGYQIMRRVLTSVSRRLVATRLQVLDMFSDAPASPGNATEGNP